MPMVKEIKNYIPLGKNRYPSGKKKTPRTQKNKKPPYVYTFSASTLKEITALGRLAKKTNNYIRGAYNCKFIIKETKC